ncbi:MAG: DUF1501 domain-containing protein [Bacteroidota bacterium]
MKRRNFLKTSLPAAAVPFALNGIPVRTMARSLMTQSFTCDQINDRILVIIQLHGGNDGLNTLIPLNQYDVYKENRPIIGILDNGPRKYLDLDTTLAVQDQVGLHPDLTGLKDLYDDGMVNFVQQVAYTNTNGSHFRGTDIWLSGKESGTFEGLPDSGWFGRYLDHKFPGYPDAYPNQNMPDPPGLEFGSHIVSLGFHRQVGIPMGLTLSNNPSNFYEQLTAVGGLLPSDIPATEYGDELKYIIEVERSTNIFAERLAAVYEQGANSSVVYPETYHTQTNNKYRNPLSGQLRTIARLISGGCKTKVYLARMGGFDTHANQAIAGKPSYGGHGALLYHLSSAIKAFMDDLKELGHADRVMGLTFSEFGRQVKENGDWGTDHGKAAPMILFGKGIKGGVTGTNPDIINTKRNNIIGFQFDYRQVFATVLQDWLGANNGTLDVTEFYEFSNKKLDLINDNYLDENGQVVNFVADPTCDDTPDLPPFEDGTTSIEDEMVSALQVAAYPNPAVDHVMVSFDSEKLIPARLRVVDLTGKEVRNLKVNLFTGTQEVRVDLSNLETGMYIVQVLARNRSDSKALLHTSKLIKQ